LSVSVDVFWLISCLLVGASTMVATMGAHQLVQDAKADAKGDSDKRCQQATT
jgi:hypothetical protein